MEKILIIELSFLALGILFASLLILILILWKLSHRISQLTQLDYDIVMPPVPNSVIEKIRIAEANYYSQTSRLRRWMERGQDIFTLLFPRIINRLNFSVGRMRMKPHTIEKLIPWAIEQGYLKLYTPQKKNQSFLLAYFAMQPLISRWQASVVIEHLREQHPQLKSMSWDDIERDSQLIQKIYSGYMGAGNDWKAWKSSLIPGPEAVRRFKKIN